MKRIVFFGGRDLGYQCLQLLIEKGCKPDFLVLNPEDKDAYKPLSLIPVVKEHNIPYIPYRELKEEKNLKRIADLNAQVGFSAFCSRILSKDVIRLFSKGISNLHFSQLPKYRGQYPTVHAIANGDKETAVTLHWINEGVDEGQVILRERIVIELDETGKSLFEKCVSVGVDLFSRQLDFYMSGSWPEGESLSDFDESLYPNYRDLPNSGQINWDWSKEKIEKFICAMSYPPHFGLDFKIGRRKFKIVEQE